MTFDKIVPHQKIVGGRHTFHTPTRPLMGVKLKKCVFHIESYGDASFSYISQILGACNTKPEKSGKLKGSRERVEYRERRSSLWNRHSQLLYLMLL